MRYILIYNSLYMLHHFGSSCILDSIWLFFTTMKMYPDHFWRTKVESNSTRYLGRKIRSWCLLQRNLDNFLHTVSTFVMEIQTRLISVYYLASTYDLQSTSQQLANKLYPTCIWRHIMLHVMFVWMQTHVTMVILIHLQSINNISFRLRGWAFPTVGRPYNSQQEIYWACKATSNTVQHCYSRRQRCNNWKVSSF